MKLPRSLEEAVREEGRDLALLVIRLGALGDILRTLPPVRLLRRALPGARVGWVADDRWCTLLVGHPDLDEVVPLPRKDLDGLRSSPSSWGRTVRAILSWSADLRRRRWDVALDFHGNLRSGIVAMVSGAPVRLGYGGHQQKEGNRAFSTHCVAPGPRRRSRMERNLDLVRALSVPSSPLPDAGLPEDPEDRAAASAVVREALGSDVRFGVLNPGASEKQSYKRPPTDLLAAAAGALRQGGIAALVVWGPGERPDAERCVDASGGAATLAPATRLGVLASLLRRSVLFVGGDTGPLHLACAVGCPVLGLYGPTDPAVNAPWGVPHVALAPEGRAYSGVKRTDRTSGGFEGLSSQAVGDAVARIISETAGR